jgi:hypothetical protein
MTENITENNTLPEFLEDFAKTMDDVDIGGVKMSFRSELACNIFVEELQSSIEEDTTGQITEEAKGRWCTKDLTINRSGLEISLTRRDYCGNHPHAQGFWTCSRYGNPVDPDSKWEGHWYCDRCGAITKEDKIEVHRELLEIAQYLSDVGYSHSAEKIRKIAAKIKD